MAAAEARAAWLRAANRFFVQEDAKRAPKFCCPASTLSCKQTETSPTNVTDGSDHRTVGFMPSNRAPSSSNLPPDAKWWLQMDPNYGLQRGLGSERVESKSADMESSPPVTLSTDSSAGEIAVMSDESICNVEYGDLESFIDVKKSLESEMKETSVSHGKTDQDFLDIENMTDYYEFLEMEMDGGSVSKQTGEFCLDNDSWIGGETMPWWRVTDGEELASFVAQKSLDHIENCDLPPPQKMHVRREPCKQANSVKRDEILLPSIDWEAQSDAFSSLSSGESMRKRRSSLKGEPSHVDDAAAEPLRTSNNPLLEKGSKPVNDPSKAKLLEALCHSQTRAREAEKAAKQAYSEKEHLLKLFFRQASQLFAYKQWFKLLQLESLLLQVNESESSSLSTFPELLPWMPRKPRDLHRNRQKSIKAKQRKRSSEENEIGKYCVAFAVGFTLVGAGLILGWTVGWLLPSF